MSIQPLILAAPSAQRPVPTAAVPSATTNAMASDSQAASFSRMLAQARQAAPAPAPAPAPVPSSGSAPKEAAEPAPRPDADTAPPEAPAAPADANGGERSTLRKTADRPAARTPAARGPTARVDKAEAEATATADRHLEKAEEGTGTPPVNAVPVPWLVAPQQADAAASMAANAGLAGFGRAGQTTPMPPAELPADGEPAPVGIGLDGSPRKDPRLQGAGPGREDAEQRNAGTAVGAKPAEPALPADELPRRAQAVEPLPAARDLANPAAALVEAPAVKTSSAETPAPLQASIATPFGSPEFRQALGVQISVLAQDGVEHAELQLNPAEMGPISVRIAMEGDQARVDFGADLARTRDVIEAGWAELAASLQEAGFTLSGGGVSQQSAGRDDNGRSGKPRGGTGARNIAGPDSVAPPRVARAAVRAGGVDLFA